MNPLLSILLAAAPALLTGAVSWWWARVQKDRDAGSVAQSQRIADLEEWRESHAAEYNEGMQRLVILEEWRKGTHEVLADLKGELGDIRQNMCRRSDLDALSARIDLALSRSTTPVPRKR